MRGQVIFINSRPIEESDERAYVRSDGRTVYRQPSWKAVCLLMALTIAGLCWLVETVWP